MKRIKQYWWISLLVILLALFFNFRVFVVLTDSMNPIIKSGDLLVSYRIDYDKLKNNDIITYQPNGFEYVTHRIVETTANNNEIITKGDRNEWEDPPHSPSPKEYKYVFKIPFLGGLLNYFQSIWTWILLITLFFIGKIFRLLIKEIKK